MRWLIVLMIAILTTSNVTGINMSFAPGVNVKNIFMYMMLAYLAVGFAIKRDFKLDQPGIQVCFAVWVLYAALTYLLGAFVIEYPRYPALGTAMMLVRVVVDPILFFLVVFYGIRQARDALFVIKGFLIIFVLANALTITDVMGLTQFGVEIGAGGAEDNRVFGFFGHANETGTLLAFLMPMLIALALTSAGRARALWGVGVAILAIVFLLNGSRGALVGLVVGGAWGAFLCRRHLNLGRIAIAGAIIAPLLLFVVLPLVSGNLGTVLIDRLLQDAGGSNMSSLSSGRTDLWSVAVNHMAALPFTFVTGYGYASWKSMSFEYDNPHSHYLGLWFELGLIGLGAFLLAIRHMVHTGRLVADSTSDPTVKYLMVGFVVGTMAMAVGVAFVLLIGPWTFIYAVMGAVMRLAVTSEAPALEAVPAATPEAPSNKFGWKAARTLTSGARKTQ